MVLRKANFYGGTHKISIDKNKVDIPITELVPIVESFNYIVEHDYFNYVDNIITLSHTSYIDHQGFVYIRATIEFDMEDDEFQILSDYNKAFGVDYNIVLLNNNIIYPYQLITNTNAELIFL